MDKEHNEDVELADDDGGNTHRTSGVVEEEAEVTHPTVGKEHNLEEGLCDEKEWHEKVEEGRP